jgi:hypothetical protein
MLDHGGPDEQIGKFCTDKATRFEELEGNISTLKAKLSRVGSLLEAAKLEAMIRELEAILDKLESS